MFDIKTVPKIVIREGSLGDTKITKSNNFYYLTINEEQWMMVDTKTNIQLREFYSSYELAYGDVLLSGLGFGILPQWLASKESISSVTVIEFNKNVVDLFLQSNKLNPKINIITTDIREYKDDFHYDWVILDHYELEKVPTKQDFELLESNLKFDNLWFWSLESKLFQYKSWQQFRQDYSLKIPDLPIDTVKKYFSTVFTQRDFPLHQ